ncbi:unnamed protein product [Sphagnum jensenii]
MAIAAQNATYTSQGPTGSGQILTNSALSNNEVQLLYTVTVTLDGATTSFVINYIDGVATLPYVPTAITCDITGGTQVPVAVQGIAVGEFVKVADASTCGSYKIQNLQHLDINLSATSGTTSFAFICPTNYQVVAVREVHAVAGGASAAVNLERLTGTTAPGSGIAILTTAIPLTGAANTTQSTAASNIITTSGTTGTQLQAGDRLGIVLSGTLTGLANCLVQGCPKCWFVLYFHDIATAPPETRAQRLDELEEVVNKSCELAARGNWDYEPYRHSKIDLETN